MTFKHKLSMRLALMRNAATAFAAIAILGCAGDMAVAPDEPSFSVTAGQVLLQENFEDAAFASRGWYDNTAMATTTAQHISGSTRALEIHFPAGATNPTWGGSARHLFQPSPTLYISYWVKYSDNWVGSGRAYHPHELYVMSDLDGDYDGPSNNWLTAYVEANFQNGGIPRLQLQDSKAINTSLGGLPNNLVATTENRSIGGCNGIVEANVVTSCFSFPPWYNDKELIASRVWFQNAPGPDYKGNWNHVEVYFQINSIANGVGRADGVMQYWFNGALAIDRHDILFRTGARPNINFRQFLIAPYIGDGSPVDQTMWIDDLTVGTGSQSAPPPPPPPPATDTSVKSVAISPLSASFAVGATRQLAATLKDVNGVTLTGRVVTWTSSAPAVATVSATGLVSALSTGSATITASSEGVNGTAAITVTAVKPSAVTNLKVASVTNNSVTLSFTEVNDGAGRPASYQVRFKAGTLSWGSGTDVANGTCKVPMSGTAIGAQRTCTVTGLAAAKAYQFQLTAFRGTLNVNAVFGALSNKVSGTTAASAPAPVAPVASVTLSPTSASLAPAATQQLAATLKDSAGNILTGRAITWASNAALVATVSNNGLVTALIAGSATITATSEGKVGSATVAVTAAPPVITNPGTVTNLSVAAVTDTSVTLSFTEVTGGAGLPASYDVRYAAGTMSWGSASEVNVGTCKVVMVGLTIGATRNCTVLGLTPGTAYQFGMVGFRGTLNVDAIFGGLSNVASGTTTAGAVPPPPVQPPPPPPSGGVWPNEPAGFTLLTDEPFNALVENGWHQAQRQTTNGSGLFLTTDLAAPFSLSSVLEFKYAAGYTGGSEPGVEYYNPSSPVKETYFSVWWKPSSGWQNHPGSSVNKLAFMFPSSGGPIYIMMFNEGGAYYINVEPEFGGDTRRLPPNRTGTPVVLGAWHRVEWYVKYSTNGSSRDGVTRWWLDGVLQGEYTDLQTPGDAGFSEYQLAPTWGGIGGTKNQTDYYWFDHARISRR